MARIKKSHRLGQALVEFAIISFVLTAMLAGFLGLIVLGLGSFQNNIATESAGRILDQHRRFSAAAFDGVFNDPTINPYTVTASQVIQMMTEDDPDFVDAYGAPLYHERHLVLSADEWEDRASLPQLNQLLLTSYIYDPDIVEPPGVIGPLGQPRQGAYRYPGAVVSRTDGSETYQTVLIPLLNIDGVEPCNDDDCQCESAHWVAPLRVCKVLDCDCDSDPPVANTPIGSEPMFTLSLVYPSQPGSLLSIEFNRNDAGNIERDDEGFYQYPVEADDANVPTKYAAELATLPDGYTFVNPSANSDFGASPSRGKYGLGETYAFVKKVRPFRRVFESRTAFRLRFGTLAAKYEADSLAVALLDEDDDLHTIDTPAEPFIDFEDNEDQFLNIRQQVIDREPDEHSLVIPDVPPTSGNFNDFQYRALVVPAVGAGVWRISVAAEFQPVGRWMEDHKLELRLYRNGVFEQLIAQNVLSPPIAGTNDSVQLLGQAVVDADATDVLQVRVFTQRPTGQTYETQLTGDRQRNWITYEFLGD